MIRSIGSAPTVEVIIYYNYRQSEKYYIITFSYEYNLQKFLCKYNFENTLWIQNNEKV